MEHKNAAQLAINVLCDLSKKHCAMCEWEQQCSDNPLLFDPIFSCQYIKESQTWLINKQSMCAKCKLQLGQHLANNQVQNAAPASNSINQLCENFKQTDNSNEKDAFPFQHFNFQELINVQNSLHAKNNLINVPDNQSVNFNQNQNSENLINTMENEIFLTNEELRMPLLHIANKLLGRQNLNFNQLTPPEQN